MTERDETSLGGLVKPIQPFQPQWAMNRAADWLHQARAARN
jgi:hypothetical protein